VYFFARHQLAHNVQVRMRCGAPIELFSKCLHTKLWQLVELSTEERLPFVTVCVFKLRDGTAPLFRIALHAASSGPSHAVAVLAAFVACGGL